MEPVPRIIQAHRGGVAVVSYCPGGGGHSLIVDVHYDKEGEWRIAACTECSYFVKGRSLVGVLMGSAAWVMTSWEIGWAEAEDWFSAKHR